MILDTCCDVYGTMSFMGLRTVSAQLHWRYVCRAYLLLDSAGAVLLVGCACDGATKPLLLMGLQYTSLLL